METIVAGGILMVPLGVCAVLSLGFILERVWMLSQTPDVQTAQDTLQEAEGVLMTGGQRAAAEHCGAGKGPLNFIFGAILKRNDALTIERREFEKTNKRLAQVAERAGSGVLADFHIQHKELSDLKEELILATEEASRTYLGKNLVVLSTIGNVAPLLGLLGTIIGMITAFEAIAVAGTGDPQAVAGGISQALVTTAAGLIVAIPTIVAHRFLAGRADNTRTSLEVYGHAYANSLIVATQSEVAQEG